MRLSVIIPVLNGQETLPTCLEALAESTRQPDELIVVDDGSTDESGNLAVQSGARVIRLEGPPRGPAAARNRAAEEAQGEVLVFLDADTAVHPDTLACIERRLEEQPEAAALFGSYDDDPPVRGLVTRYKNLLHHYVHQRGGRRRVSTFWAGCGAIRRELFQAFGGFDERYRHPSIEDIELGVRLRQAGHTVWLCPEVQVTHLKRWTLSSLIRVDIRDRAIPWTRLIMRSGHMPDDLNLNAGSRWSAAAAWIGILSLTLGFGCPFLWLGLPAALLAVGCLNSGLYRFLAGRGGAGFAAGAGALHLLYLLYSSLAFALVAIPTWLGRYGLALLLLSALFKGLAWSVVAPPWHAPDEMQHLFYAQIIERFHTLEVRPDNHEPLEAGALYRLAQIPEVRYRPQPLDLSDRGGIAAQIAELDEPETKQTYRFADGRGYDITRRFVSFHPPLYYLLQALIQWPLERWSVLVRLLAARWVSVLLGMATVALAYAAGRELWPRRPAAALWLATLVSFQPTFTFVTSVMGNVALETTLLSAVLLVLLRVARQGMTARRGLLLGTLVGLGLLTKISFLSALPLLAAVAVWDAARHWRTDRRRLRHWVWTALLPPLIAGWWYPEAILSGGANLLAGFGTASVRPTVTLLPYLLRYGWVSVYRSQLEMYWGNFGWLDTPLHPTLLLLLTWATVAASWTAGWWVARRLRRDPVHGFSFLLLAAATVSLMGFYTGLDYRAASTLGGSFNLQGRYFLPGVIGQMAWFGLGLVAPVPVRWRRWWRCLVAGGMAGLNGYALFRTVLPRYYGPGRLLTMLERATVLQPVSFPVLLAFCGLMVGLSAALLVALSEPGSPSA